MSKPKLVLAVALAALVGAGAANAQSAKSSLIVKTRMTLGGKPVKFSRKRFYLFRGGLDVNKTLVDRIKAAPYTSRDCFYCQQKASAEYIAWLRAGDCESPYCHEISADDIAKVPEFKAAYQKSLAAYKKPDVARMWLTTNMTRDLRDGYYRERKQLIDTIFGNIKPLATVMTDASSQQATFIDVDVLLKTGKSSETFLLTNILPFETGDKAYTWICEVALKPAANSLILPASDTTAHVKTCDVVVKDLPKCANGSCSQ